MNDKTGQVNSTKLVQDISHIFPKSTEGAAIHVGNLDRNSLKFMSSQMSTRWIPDTEFVWNLLLERLDEQGHKSMVTVSAGNLTKAQCEQHVPQGVSAACFTREFVFKLTSDRFSKITIVDFYNLARLNYLVIEIVTIVHLGLPFWVLLDPTLVG